MTPLALRPTVVHVMRSDVVTADEWSRSLSNVGLPRTDRESMFWAVFAASENPMAIVDANRWSFRRTARCSAC
jgi:hypothetical protein